MEIRFSVKGPERKRLVQVIEKALEVKSRYLGAPSMAYEIGAYAIDRNGTLSFEERGNTGEVRRLLDAISSEGFGYEAPADSAEEITEAATGEESWLMIAVPLDKVNTGNLTRLLEAKGSLIRKALGADNIRIEVKEDCVSFPWFAKLPFPDEAKAYTHFIAALCEMSRNATRVTAKEKEVDNEKYAFRCFLLRLGFIGEEYKAQRKILLKNLSGSAAFPTTAAADAFNSAQKEKRRAAKEVSV